VDRSTARRRWCSTGATGGSGLSHGRIDRSEAVAADGCVRPPDRRLKTDGSPAREYPSNWHDFPETSARPRVTPDLGSRHSGQAQGPRRGPAVWRLPREPRPLRRSTLLRPGFILAGSPTLAVVVASLTDTSSLREWLGEPVEISCAYGLQLVVARGGLDADLAELRREYPGAVFVTVEPDAATIAALRRNGCAATTSDVVYVVSDTDRNVSARIRALIHDCGLHIQSGLHD
jgi:hypothetical protein